jgi:Lhr-like helicase
VGASAAPTWRLAGAPGELADRSSASSLSATAGNSDNARYLGQATAAKWAPRPVSIVDAGALKKLEIRVEVPVEDMARLSAPPEPRRIGNAKGPPGEQVFVREMGATTMRSGGVPAGEPAAQAGAGGAERRSIWPSIHPRLIELIRSHRATILFTNSRRLAERLAASLNELAGEELVRAHHGSIAREQRVEIEEALKSGGLRAIVATSSSAGHRHGRGGPRGADRDAASAAGESARPGRDHQVRR